jgi:predicted MFS family arabinose efflux permease
MALPQVVFGISNSLFWATQSAYVTEVLFPAKRASAIGILMAISALGSILSPTIAGYIIDHAGYQPVFFVYIAIAAVGFVTARTLPKLPTDFRGSVVATIVTGYSGVGTLLKRPALQVTTMNTFFQYTSIAVAESLISAFLREAHYSATFIGTNIALRTAAMTAIRLFIGPLVKRLGNATLLFGGVLTCAVASALVPILPNPAFIYLANGLLGASFGVVPVMTSTQIAENSSTQERGIAMATDATSASSGRTATGFGFGAVAQMVGYGNTIIIANGFVVAGTLLAIQRYVSGKRQRSTLEKAA